MKKLGKLSINPEKVIRNEELVNLRGGYTGDTKKWAYYKCCWDDDTDNCSTCSWTNDPTCVEGASAVEC